MTTFKRREFLKWAAAGTGVAAIGGCATAGSGSAGRNVKCVAEDLLAGLIAPALPEEGKKPQDISGEFSQERLGAQQLLVARQLALLFSFFRPVHTRLLGMP